jgi:hypothetical protein
MQTAETVRPYRRPRYFCPCELIRSTRSGVSLSVSGSLEDMLLNPVLSFESNESNVSQIKRGLSKSNDPPV